MVAMAAETVDKGRRSLNEGSQGIREEWSMAAQMELQYGGPGMWVPWRAIEIREDILPREQKFPDRETVERYAADFYNLPPITVQRGTFVLIDGRHRLEAAKDASPPSRCVRVEEVDVSDEDIAEAAFLTNVRHGRPLSPTERVKGAKMLLSRHGPDRPESERWPVVEIARRSGVSRSTIDKWLKPAESPRAAPPVALPQQNVRATAESEAPAEAAQKVGNSDFSPLSDRAIPKPAAAPTQQAEPPIRYEKDPDAEPASDPAGFDGGVNLAEVTAAAGYSREYIGTCVGSLLWMNNELASLQVPPAVLAGSLEGETRAEVWRALRVLTSGLGGYLKAFQDAQLAEMRKDPETARLLRKDEAS